MESCQNDRSDIRSSPAIAGLSLFETRRSNRKAEEHRQRDLQAELVVEKVDADRYGMGKDLLSVTLRNIGRADAVGIESSIFLKPAWYPRHDQKTTIPAGASAVLLHELVTGAVVRRPLEPDGQGGFTGEVDWVIPKGGQIELRFRDASGPRTETLSLES